MKIIIGKNIIFSFFFLIYSNSVIAKPKTDQFQLEAEKSIEYFEKQKIYVATGNAIASKGNFSIKAEKITAFISKTKNSDIKDIEATGSVIIRNIDTIAKSSSAKYSFKNKFIILTGDNQSVESKKFRLMSKKFISFDDINKIAESEGNVKLFLSGPVSISSERINAKFDKTNNVLITASANGNVKIQTKSETITSNSAKYNNIKNIIFLKGNVVIKRDTSVLTGEKGYLNLNTSKSKIESSKSKRVKGVFSPINK